MSVFLFSCLFNGIEEKKADDEGENFELEQEGCWWKSQQFPSQRNNSKKCVSKKWKPPPNLRAETV